MNASRSSSKNQSVTNRGKADLSESNLSFDESILQLIDEPFESRVNSATKLRTDFKYNGFDQILGGTWIYPTNYPVRQYQLHISRVSLFKNTLVSYWHCFTVICIYLFSTCYNDYYFCFYFVSISYFLFFLGLFAHGIGQNIHCIGCNV